MRKIQIETWKAKAGDGSDVEESLIVIIDALISKKKPEEMPKGLESFRIMHRLASAFDRAINTKILELDEKDYDFVRNTIITDIPSTWGFNKNIHKAIEDFMNAKEA